MAIIHNRKPQWRDKNKYKSYGCQIKKYWPGLTYKQALLQYQKLLADQKGLCAICMESQARTSRHDEKPKKLCVDHCHKTGKVRGLLCQDCNRALGLMRDDPDIFIIAASYLEGKST